MKLFQATKPPLDREYNLINNYAEWNTWSSEALLFLKKWNIAIKDLEEPNLISVLEGKPYDYTYSLNPYGLVANEIYNEFKLFSETFYNLKISQNILLFSNLLSPEFNSTGLHFLFACMRNYLVEMTGDILFALYTPLGTTTNGAVYISMADFGLHADLYPPKNLFNVFEEVDNDSSGASIFLQTSVLSEILDDINTISSENKSKILDPLFKEDKEDHYTEFFNLLHGHEHRWVDELERIFKARQIRIKMKKGEGYLINDRMWLHGRESTTLPVTEKRLHRFIFNTMENQNKI